MFDDPTLNELVIASLGSLFGAILGGIVVVHYKDVLERVRADYVGF